MLFKERKYTFSVLSFQCNIDTLFLRIFAFSLKSQKQVFVKTKIIFLPRGEETCAQTGF